MASYSIPPASPAWQTLPAPTADAWLQPLGADIYISTDTVPSKNTAGVIPSQMAYPVTAGVAVKIAVVGPVRASVRMWDKT